MGELRIVPSIFNDVSGLRIRPGAMHFAFHWCIWHDAATHFSEVRRLAANTHGHIARLLDTPAYVRKWTCISSFLPHSHAKDWILQLHNSLACVSLYGVSCQGLSGCVRNDSNGRSPCKEPRKGACNSPIIVLRQKNDS